MLAACSNIADSPKRDGAVTDGAKKVQLASTASASSTAPAPAALPRKFASQAELTPASLHRLPLGLLLREMTTAERESQMLDHGVLVVIAVGASAIAGVREGDIILSVNQTQVKTVDQFWLLMDAANWRAALVIHRGDSRIVIDIGEWDREAAGPALQH